MKKFYIYIASLLMIISVTCILTGCASYEEKAAAANAKAEEIYNSLLGTTWSYYDWNGDDDIHDSDWEYCFKIEFRHEIIFNRDGTVTMSRRTTTKYNNVAKSTGQSDEEEFSEITISAFSISIESIKATTAIIDFGNYGTATITINKGGALSELKEGGLVYHEK